MHLGAATGLLWTRRLDTLQLSNDGLTAEARGLCVLVDCVWLDIQKTRDRRSQTFVQHDVGVEIGTAATTSDFCTYTYGVASSVVLGLATRQGAHVLFLGISALMHATNKVNHKAVPLRTSWAARGTHHLAKLVRRVRVLLDVPCHSPQESAPFDVVSCSCSCSCCWSSASISPTSRDGPSTRHGWSPFFYSACRGASYSAGMLALCCCGRQRARLGESSCCGTEVRPPMSPLFEPGNDLGVLGVAARGCRAGPLQLAWLQRYHRPHKPHGIAPQVAVLPRQNTHAGWLCCLLVYLIHKPGCYRAHIAK